MTDGFVEECRVLIADDDALLAGALARELHEQGYVVQLAEDGVAAWACVQAWKPHVVILDRGMPRLDGMGVCRNVRAAALPVRILMLTAAGEVSARVSGLDEGADDYVAKPFDMDELLARLRAQVRNAGLRPLPSAVLSGLSHPSTRAEALRALREHPAPGLDFQVLGDFKIGWHGTDVTKALWNRRQPRTLLKALLLSYDRRVPNDVLIERLWPQEAPQDGRHGLHVAARRLRDALAPFGQGRIETLEGGYRLRLLDSDTFDLADFDRACARADNAGEMLCNIYRAELLADDPYTDWVTVERDRVRARFTDLVSRTVQTMRLAGRHLDTIPLLSRMLELDPLDEERAADLVEAMLAVGDGAAAAAVLMRSRRAIEAHLGAPCGSRLQALHARVTGC